MIFLKDFQEEGMGVTLSVPVAQLVRAYCLYTQVYFLWIQIHGCRNGKVAGSIPAGNKPPSGVLER
uniref:Uncharacterized protein n=1 Tax=viral metagenome TaxID=1070528 RepID=A0A6C0LVW0_9ZZZZ